MPFGYPPAKLQCNKTQRSRLVCLHFSLCKSRLLVSLRPLCIMVLKLANLRILEGLSDAYCRWTTPRAWAADVGQAFTLCDFRGWTGNVGFASESGHRRAQESHCGSSSPRLRAGFADDDHAAQHRAGRPRASSKCAGAPYAKARRSGGTQRIRSRSRATMAAIARPVTGKSRPMTTAMLQSTT